MIITFEYNNLEDSVIELLEEALRNQLKEEEDETNQRLCSICLEEIECIQESNQWISSYR